MDFRCPRCGTALDVEAARTHMHMQCPGCAAIFRSEEALRTTGGGQDDIIDVRAEVISSEGDVSDREDAAEALNAVRDTGVEPVAAGYGEPTADGTQEPPVYFARHFTVERREGCGCSGCGCLVMLFLLLYLLAGCMATL